MIITAFVGYVLPWGQISYWGATVITNLVSSVYSEDLIFKVVLEGLCVFNPKV